MPLRPIPREVPLPPDMSGEELAAIERAVFYEAPAKPSDVFLIFGYTRKDGWDVAVDMAKRGLGRIIVPTGYMASEPLGETVPQSWVIRDALLAAGIEADRIVVEDRSRNTAQNVAFAKEELLRRGIIPASIVFTSKSHHSGRCYRTIRTHFGDIPITCGTEDAVYDGVTVNRETWQKDPHAQGRVYAEYLRICAYTQSRDLLPM